MLLNTLKKILILILIEENQHASQLITSTITIQYNNNGSTLVIEENKPMKDDTKSKRWFPEWRLDNCEFLTLDYVKLIVIIIMILNQLFFRGEILIKIKN